MGDLPVNFHGAIMKFYQFKLNKFSKRLSIILSGLFLLSHLNLNASSLPALDGLPQRISPIPGPANPDPVLQNLKAVMDEFFQKPWYEGLTPFDTNYLGGIIYFSDYYSVRLSGLVINPVDDRIMHIAFSQNFMIDTTGTFTGTRLTNTFATSFDGGVSWKYGPPIVQIIPLGGTISQVINASAGPGLAFKYGKCGKLFAYGNGFFDTHPNPPNTLPLTGFLFTTSKDNGKCWKTPKSLTNISPPLPSDIDTKFTSASGLRLDEWFITPDPANNNLIHGVTNAAIFPAYNFGNVYYNRSEDGGKNFSLFKLVYSMVNDPVWLTKFFDPDFTSDPNYFTYGGVSILSGELEVIDENVVLIPITRIYPKVGSTTFSGGLVTDSNVDAGVIRSLDKGKTWCKVAGVTDLFPLSLGPNDPGYEDPTAKYIGTSSFLKLQPVTSSATGRVYLTYEAGTTDSNPDPILSQFFTEILLSVSSDQGATFSPAVRINRTPTNISVGAQEAYGHAAVYIDDGWFVVGYFDLRNWTGFPGEDVNTTPLPTDVWLDIYREVDDPRGGSTGIGLDFVKEIRVTPQSFNTRLGSESPLGNQSGTDRGIKLAVNKKNELFVIYYTPNESSSANISTGYLGMTIDRNSYYNIIMQRVKFPKPSNQ